MFNRKFSKFYNLPDGVSIVLDEVVTKISHFFVKVQRNFTLDRLLFYWNPFVSSVISPDTHIL